MASTLSLLNFFSINVEAAAVASETNTKKGKISVSNPMLLREEPLERGALRITKSDLGDIGDDLLLFSKAIQKRIFENTPSTPVLGTSFALGVAQGFCRLVLDNNNFSYTMLPLILDVDPVLEHPAYNKASPDYNAAMHGRLTGYLLYINFAYNIMYSGQMTTFTEELFNVVHHAFHGTSGIPSREGTLWGRRALRLAAIGLGGAESFIELSLFFENGVRYGTLARNAATIPFALLSILHQNFAKLDAHIDRALLYLAPGATSEIAEKRNSLVDLLYRTEWTIATHLTDDEISELFKVTSGERKIKFIEEEDVERAAAAPSTVGVAITEEDNQGLDALVRIRHLVQHGAAFPDLVEEDSVADSDMMTSHQLWRNRLRWTGQILGTTAAWGFSVATKHVIEGAMLSNGFDPSSAEITGYTIGTAMGLGRTAGVSHGLGNFLVSLYDSATGFVEPSTRVERDHADPYDGKSAYYNVTKRMWSFLHGGVYPLVLLAAALPEMGYDWDLVITEDSFRIDYDPNNAPLGQALWPLIPMAIAAAIPETDHLGLSLGKTVNTVSEIFFRARGSSPASVHRARLIKQIQKLTQAIVHAPDPVIEQAHALFSAKEKVNPDLQRTLSRRILNVASGKTPTAASGKGTTSPTVVRSRVLSESGSGAASGGSSPRSPLAPEWA